MSPRARHLTSLYTTAAAAAWAVLAPLLALAYFATEQGAEQLEAATVAAWAEPARELAGGLLTFAGPDQVYAVYGFLLMLLFPAVILGALAARSLRPAGPTRGERWGWRLAISGYVLFSVGGFLVAIALVAAGPTAPVVDGLFLTTMIPGMLLSLIGSTVLGVALLRARFRPRVTGWLLALAIPVGVAGSVVLGHNSLGLFPLVVAWAAASPARRFAAEARPAT